ncbi:Maf family protein [Thioalkalicoccus limnaeus]|uniref:7-methyl-GTP pyrophosphatase n=1 Tax=Thioalkalicoccus limnaeus TaxID=120681 RepID=A0ABV4BG60_9GAMM
MPPLLLASSSPYRRDLLARLGLPFTAMSPDIDETRRADEDAHSLVLRLSEAKARALARDHPQALIIGSDQVACVEDQILGKPGGHEQAIAQLERLSGRTVEFLTGLCVISGADGPARCVCEPFRVRFRRLTRAQITAYVERERPYDCAGSFKSEGLGIALFERLSGDDPTALIGLPLIRLVELLGDAGVDVLGRSSVDGSSDP